MYPPCASFKVTLDLGIWSLDIQFLIFFLFARELLCLFLFKAHGKKDTPPPPISVADPDVRGKWRGGGSL